jgi:hypothetical protein
VLPDEDHGAQSTPRGSEPCPQGGLYLVKRLCDLTLQETGTHFGEESYGVVGWARSQVRAKQAVDQPSKKRVEQVEAFIRSTKNLTPIPVNWSVYIVPAGAISSGSTAHARDWQSSSTQSTEDDPTADTVPGKRDTRDHQSHHERESCGGCHEQ